MLNDIYEHEGKAYRITSEDPLMGVEYVFDGKKFKSIGEPVEIEGNKRIALNIVKMRHREDSQAIEDEEADDETDLTKTEIMSQLDEKGIEYNSRSKKTELLELLEG